MRNTKQRQQQLGLDWNNSAVNTVNTVNAGGQVIDGIGSQTHLSVSAPPVLAP